MRDTQSDHTSVSLSDRRANDKVMTYRPPRRATRSPLPAPRSPLFFAARPFPSFFTGRCLGYTQLLRMKNIQWFIQLFVFYMILINGIAVYFAFCFVASRAQSYITYCMIFLNELIIRVRFLTFQHYVSIFIILFNDSYLNKSW